MIKYQTRWKLSVHLHGDILGARDRQQVMSIKATDISNVSQPTEKNLTRSRHRIMFNM